MILIIYLHIKTHVALSQKPLFVTNNSYRRIFHTEQNLCDIITNKVTHILASPIIKVWQPYTNMLSGCPFTKVMNSFFFFFLVFINNDNNCLHF